jgi:hypothetical protein
MGALVTRGCSDVDGCGWMYFCMWLWTGSRSGSVGAMFCGITLSWGCQKGAQISRIRICIELCAMGRYGCGGLNITSYYY